MPEIKHNFTGGKMQKDLDERLVPNGQYKDAMNIQVSTSEGSDVGTAQNILGNSLIPGQGFIGKDAYCVGSIADEKNDKLYYFIDNSTQMIQNTELNNGSNWLQTSGITADYDDIGVKLTTDPTIITTQYPVWYNSPSIDLIDGQTYRVDVKFSEVDNGGTSGSKIYMLGIPGDPTINYRPYYDDPYENVIIENGDYVNIFKFDQSLNNNETAARLQIEILNGDDYIKKLRVNSISFVERKCCVIEYDSKTNSITPVLVDTTGDVLQFSSDRLITGINIIDDMLFWTDNYSEPKKINIPRCIKGTDKSGTIHTRLINESRDIDIDSGIDLEEKHITVIRKSPRTAPTIELISERDPNSTYSGIMRITTDPGGLVEYGLNTQNASSLWFDSTSNYNHLYDFSTLTIGDRFRTNIETDINGDSGFDLDWSVGDTVVFKEFSGDTYDDAPSIPITDYTIKAKILSDNNNDFSDTPTELAPNNDLTLPNINGSRPLGYTWSSAAITYVSPGVVSGVLQPPKIVFDGVGGGEKVVPSSTLTPALAVGTGNSAGIYKVRVEIANLTAGQGGFTFVKTVGGTQHYWSFPGGLLNGVNETTMTLDTSLSLTTSAFAGYSGKFFIQSGGASSNSFEILNISIERQDVTDAGVKLEVIGINGVPAMVPDGYSELRYAVDLLDEEENLFEFKFPRFAYRYQYEDKEYSAFSPFTEVAFLPGSFDFHPQKGYNLGMTNGLKEITIKNFIPGDGIVDDVVAVDILYKDEASPNIYVIDTIKNNQHGSDIWTSNEYTIKSESVKRVLPSNQLLRPWDAVPKKALAQEISGNRIIYGNYTQGFDLLKPGTKQEYYPDFDFSIKSDNIGLNTVKSIKSLREYQLGVVFVDKYGRETPVLSNASGLDKVPKIEAAKSNKMEVSFGNTVFPENMEYFKFFVKETSGEYYNMTMDRWWDADDGLAWLSFGSADINKIDVDTFLILKKGVESNDLVTEPARYKVLAIETEAPDHIKTKKTLIEERTHTFATTNIFGSTVNDAPLLGRDTFKMRYQPFGSGSGSELHNIEDGILYVEFTFGSVVSKRYRVTGLTTDRDQKYAAGGVVGAAAAMFSVKLDKNLGEDVNFICDDPNDGLNPTKIVDGAAVRFYKYTPENSSEFDGRFFVKVVSDGVFVENITTTNAEAVQYRTTLSRKLYYMGSDQAALHSEVLTGQTHGVYADTVATYTNLNNFGRFAPFFRNYKWESSTDWILPYGAPLGSQIDVGQYRFDDTSEGEWKGELESHTALTTFNQSWNAPDLKDADHSGWDDETNDASTRYGVFNGNGEQTKGNVWFIDGGPFAGTRSASDTDLAWAWHWQTDALGTGISTGNMLIAMGGIYTPGGPDGGGGPYSLGDVFNIGSSTWYGGQKFKDLVGKISPSVKFRFREDPTSEVYTIKPSGVTYMNRLRWSDGGITYPNTGVNSGEYPAYSGAGSNAYARVPQLSPNITRGYSAKFINDRLKDTATPGEVTWDPTNGGATGAIAGGLHLTATRSQTSNNTTSFLPMVKVSVTDIHDLTCGVNGGKYSITKGMILTSYGGITLDGTFTDPNGNAGGSFSHEPLIVESITGTGPYNLYLTGYSSPILGSNLSGTGLLKHRVFDTAPASGESMVFQQPAMNGYSQYSVNRINMQNANGDGSSLDNPALLAVGYTIEFLEEIEGDVEFPDNPAIWETEPKETTDLDIYYEASGYNPFVLTEDNKYAAIPSNSLISHDGNPNSIVDGTNIRGVYLFDGSQQSPFQITPSMSGTTTNYYILTQSPTPNLTFSTAPLVGGAYINVGDSLTIQKADGSSVSVKVKGWMNEGLANTYSANRTEMIFIEKALIGPDTKYTLSWHNCYSFGNGVESNRIRDTYNLPYIANGVKASTTLDEHPYEEKLKYGLIYSGIYNGAVGMNNLNQFIAAEKISKNINPTYGSIQKLKAGWGQGGDLITLCEDRVLKILANKDALFNADGNPQLLATNAVLGQAIPYSGEYGISTNPESFASEAYRAYFTDRVRGSVMRLSIDGLTPISNHGMKDWFRDNLKPGLDLIGSYDDRQDEYNLTLRNSWMAGDVLREPATVSFREDVKGWVSFKSFIQENGLSCANGYYTFANGRLWKHHVENFSELTKVTVTGVQHANGAADDGKYFFFEIDEMDRLLGGNWDTTVTKIKQYRGNLLIREDDVYIFANAGNSLNPPSPSGGTTKGHGRYNSGSATGDWEVGDIIVIGNIDRNTFYDTFTNSGLNVLLNDTPSSIKSYHTLDYEGSQSRVVQNLQDDEYYNLTDKDGWYVSNIETNKEKGSLLEFIEKEGKWFNYIKGFDSNFDDIDFGSSEVQGLGVQSEMVLENANGLGDGTVRIFIDGGINCSLQVGDAVYYQLPDSEEIFSAGVVVTNPSFFDGITGPTQDLFQVDMNDLFSNTPNDPGVGTYWMFVKNQVVNMNGLSGYYADARFENNSKVKAELFAVSSEVTESSK